MASDGRSHQSGLSVLILNGGYGFFLKNIARYYHHVWSGKVVKLKCIFLIMFALVHEIRR